MKPEWDRRDRWQSLLTTQKVCVYIKGRGTRLVPWYVDPATTKNILRKDRTNTWET